MGYCRQHPERETAYCCQKHGHHVCQECLRCGDPGLYCKFRSACPIWFLQKNGPEWGEKKSRDVRAPSPADAT